MLFLYLQGLLVWRLKQTEVGMRRFLYLLCTLVLGAQLSAKSLADVAPYTCPVFDQVGGDQEEQVVTCSSLYARRDLTTESAKTKRRCTTLGVALCSLGIAIAGVATCGASLPITVPIAGLVLASGAAGSEGRKFARSRKEIRNNKKMNRLVQSTLVYVEGSSAPEFEKFYQRYFVGKKRRNWFGRSKKEQKTAAEYSRNQVAAAIIWHDWTLEGMCVLFDATKVNGKTYFRYLDQKKFVESLKAYLEHKHKS